jgi:molybdate transport system regulatory protein
MCYTRATGRQRHGRLGVNRHCRRVQSSVVGAIAMQVKYNVWVEKSGQVALSRWRVALLQAVHETGSISAAAQRMGIPYHRAWDKIHECEARLGLSLLATQTGGIGGGGARLTAEGADLVTRFQCFSQGLDEMIRARFQEAFGDLEPGSTGTPGHTLGG